MKIYVLKVSYKDGVVNMNEAFTTLKEAQKQVHYRTGKDYYYVNEYMYVDLDNLIIYEIKEVELNEKADKNKEDRVFYDTL